MSLVSALAQLEAMRSGSAQPVAAFRHRHLSDRPLVLVPLSVAGEAAAPLAVIAGTSRLRGQILVVPQPRNRDQRFAFAAELGRIVVDYLDSFRTERVEVPATRNHEASSRYTDAPQILVPNRGGVTALAQLGRMTRFRKTDGPAAVDPVVPLAGAWLTHLAERAEQAGTSTLLAMTDLLSELWATGQSALENQNLASLLGWIDPPAGMTGLEAALEAEDPGIWPPAGPATDPDFDNKVLGPAVDAFNRARAAGDRAAQEAGARAVRDALASQLQPTWSLMWRGAALARAVPPARRVPDRWARECADFTEFSDRLADGGRPQPKRDYPISAAVRLSRLEQALTDFGRDRALDDPYAMADLRCTGEAFGGTVESVDPDRIVVSDRNRKLLRPRFTLRTPDPVRIQPGTALVSPAFASGHKSVLAEVLADDDESVLTIEITGGTGTAKQRIAGAMPQVGDHLDFLADPGYRPTPVFPEVGRTPWTHGGPPTAPDTVEQDPAEEWGEQ